MEFDGKKEALERDAKRTRKATTKTAPRAASEAAKTEAVEDSVTFEYDGVTYTAPPAIEWDVEVFEAAEDGKIVSAVRALIGPDQWAKFKEKKRTIVNVSELFDAAKAALGVTPGESDS